MDLEPLRMILSPENRKLTAAAAVFNPIAQATPGTPAKGYSANVDQDQLAGLLITLLGSCRCETVNTPL